MNIKINTQKIIRIVVILILTIVATSCSKKNTTEPEVNNPFNNNNTPIENNQEKNEPEVTNNEITDFPRSTPDGTIIAMVGEEAVMDYEYSFYYSYSRNTFLSNKGISDQQEAEEHFSSVEGILDLDDIEKAARDNIIVTKIFVSKAAEKNVTLTETEIQEMNDSINLQVDSFSSVEEAQNTFLNYYGANIEQLKYIFAQQMLMEKFYSEEMELIEVATEDAKNVYESNPTQFDTVKVTHVFVHYTTQDRTEEESYILAEEILTKAKNGEDLNTLAHTYSEDENVPSNHGSYSVKSAAESPFAQTFINWGLNTEIGNMEIVPSQYGFHIIRMEGREGNPFEIVQEQITDSIKVNLLDTMIEEWKQDPKYQFTEKQ